MIKVLNIVSALDCGGVENFLYNYYSKMDNNEIKFDFIVHEKDVGMLETKFIEIGANVYHVTPKKQSFLKNIKEINQIIKQGKYDIVHCHQGFSSFSSLACAKLNGVKVRIVHSHVCNKNGVSGIKQKILRFLNKITGNCFFACSEAAGKWVYGENWQKNDRNKIINNGIDLEKFEFNEQVRHQYREQFNIKNEKVLLQIGRLSNEKNQLFSIKLLEQLKNTNNNYKLIIVGNGSTKQEIETQINNMNLRNDVILLEKRDDINNLMSMSDILLFPSLYEGFGMVAVEAQANSLNVIASTNVPKEVKITNGIDFLDLENIEQWIEKIENVTKRKIINQEQFNKYNIQKLAKSYENILKKLVLEGN